MLYVVDIFCSLLMPSIEQVQRKEGFEFCALFHHSPFKIQTCPPLGVALVQYPDRFLFFQRDYMGCNAGRERHYSYSYHALQKDRKWEKLCHAVYQKWIFFKITTANCIFDVTLQRHAWGAV